LKLLKFALSLRHYSPKVAAMIRIGHTHLKSQPLSNSMTYNIQSETELFDFDHRTSENCTIIVYSRLGTPDFHKLYQDLKTKKIHFVLRHFDPFATSDFVTDDFNESEPLIGLQGYGVELVFKNMEYNAMDQKANVIPQESTDSESFEHDTDIDGINFKLLHEKYPTLEGELYALKNSLLDQTKTDKIDAWDMKDIGIQASQRIVQSVSPFTTLEYISQNLPSLMQTLTRVRVNESLRGEIIANHGIFQPGQNLVIFNGKTLNIDKFTPFSLLDTIRYEISILGSSKRRNFKTLVRSTTI
jgi:UDP-glucose:glycoprotein glucosyltransferase